MTVLFATLGYTATLVVAPLRQRPDITEMHVFYDDSTDKRRDEALDAVRKVTKAFGVRLVEHQGKDGFDYDHFLRMFVQVYDKIPDGADVVFNASGGPRPMTMAATIFCFTHNVPLMYYDEYNTKEGKTIPLKAYRSLHGLGPAKMKILRRLKKGPLDVSTLADKLDLAASTTSVHVQELGKMGLITIERDGKHRMVHLLPEVEMLDLESVTG